MLRKGDTACGPARYHLRHEAVQAVSKRAPQQQEIPKGGANTNDTNTAKLKDKARQGQSVTHAPAKARVKVCQVISPGLAQGPHPYVNRVTLAPPGNLRCQYGHRRSAKHGTATVNVHDRLTFNLARKKNQAYRRATRPTTKRSGGAHPRPSIVGRQCSKRCV